MILHKTIFTCHSHGVVNFLCAAFCLKFGILRLHFQQVPKRINVLISLDHCGKAVITIIGKHLNGQAQINRMPNQRLMASFTIRPDISSYRACS